MAKYLIKCSKCGKLVEIGEYTMLCPFCKKKLDNSFKECQKKDPDITYQIYLDRYCVNELAIGGISEQRKISRNAKLRSGLKNSFMTIVLIICASAVVLWGIWMLSSAFTGQSIKNIVSETWRGEYYEDLSCNIKFPYALSLQDGVKEDSTLGIVDYVARAWKKEDVCMVTALKIDYTSDSISNIDLATNGILQSMVSSNSMEGFTFVPSDYKVQGAQARMFSGSYLIDVKMYEFRAVMLLRNTRIWYFMVAYPQALPEGTILADKLFNGIQLLDE